VVIHDAAGVLCPPEQFTLQFVQQSVDPAVGERVIDGTTGGAPE